MKLLDEKHNLNLTHAPDVEKKKKNFYLLKEQNHKKINNNS